MTLSISHKLKYKIILEFDIKNELQFVLKSLCGQSNQINGHFLLFGNKIFDTKNTNLFNE